MTYGIRPYVMPQTVGVIIKANVDVNCLGNVKDEIHTEHVMRQIIGSVHKADDEATELYDMELLDVAADYVPPDHLEVVPAYEYNFNDQMEANRYD